MDWRLLLSWLLVVAVGEFICILFRNSRKLFFSKYISLRGFEIKLRIICLSWLYYFAVQHDYIKATAEGTY